MPWFTPDSFMNVRIDTLPKVDASSAKVVAKLAGWVHGQTFDIGGGQTYSTAGRAPYFDEMIQIFPANWNRVQPVRLTGGWWLMDAQQPLANEVPVPDDAVGDRSSDKSLVIVDEDSGKVWEFWRFNRDPRTGALTAVVFGMWDDHRKRTGVWSAASCPPLSAALIGSQWGVRASGFSLLAGVTTQAELAAGVIEHATAFTVPQARSPWFSAPAQRVDGKGADTAPDSIPYGARFKLPATFDAAAYEASRRTRGWDGKTPEPKFTLTRTARAVIEAWKHYGAVPVDRTYWSVGIQVESTASSRSRLGTAAPVMYWEASKDAIARSLPWERLQMAQLDLRRRP